jgi:hypothetical protein
MGALPDRVPGVIARACRWREKRLDAARLAAVFARHECGRV